MEINRYVAGQTTVNAVNESTTTYNSTVSNDEIFFNESSVNVFPNPASDLIAVQINALVKFDIKVSLMDLKGSLIEKKNIPKGSTIAYFDIQTLYDGIYIVSLTSASEKYSKKITINR